MRRSESTRSSAYDRMRSRSEHAHANIARVLNVLLAWLRQGEATPTSYRFRLINEFRAQIPVLSLAQWLSIRFGAHISNTHAESCQYSFTAPGFAPTLLCLGPSACAAGNLFESVTRRSFPSFSSFRVATSRISWLKVRVEMRK